MTKNLVIVGCGGFGREVVSIVDAVNAASSEPEWNLLGFVDDAPSQINVQRAHSLGIELAGTSEALHDGPLSEAWFVIAIGDPQVRRRIAVRIDADDRAATLVDPEARIGRDVRLGRGTIVAAGAHVTTNIAVGAHVHVDRGVQVGHDSVLHDFVTLHPAATISGDGVLESAVRVGTSATVLPGVHLAAHVCVGAGACVDRDVARGLTVKGVPAR